MPSPRGAFRPGGGQAPSPWDDRDSTPDEWGDKCNVVDQCEGGSTDAGAECLPRRSGRWAAEDVQLLLEALVKRAEYGGSGEVPPIVRVCRQVE